MKKILVIISAMGFGGAQKIAAQVSEYLEEQYELDFLVNYQEDVTVPYKGNTISLGIRKPNNPKSIFYQMEVFFKRFVFFKKQKKIMICA